MKSSPEVFLDDIMKLLSGLSNDTLENFVAHTMGIVTSITNADGCFFFHITSSHFMNLIYSKIESLNTSISGTSNMRLFPSVFLPDIKDKKNKRPAEACAINKEIINSSNIFNEPNIEASFLKEFDKNNNYNTISALIFPVFDSKNNVIGVVQLINAKDVRGKITTFSTDKQETIMCICHLIGIVLERKQLAESYTQLLESFVDVLAKAIDAKSPYTGLHCQKVPIITRMLASAAVQDTEGPLKNFEMSDDDWYALHIASWLHDCGKIITPEHIMNKSVKLETIYNRIHEIRNRFEILRRDAHIEYLQKRLQNADTQENLQAEFISKVKKLSEDFEFVGQCNVGDKPLSKEDIKRLDEISNLSFVRYFNRMVGLSWGEKKLINAPSTYAKPEVEYVLQNREEQLGGLYNQGELYNLKINQGTINDTERQKINEHITTTINMLKALPFPKELSNIIEYAGSHHEHVDGTGYPNGLRGYQMSVPAKIMAVADVYEALTAKDRPYKEPKKLSEVLTIMQEMKNSGHLDPDLYDLFIKSGVYLDYAKEYIDKEQIDIINPEEFL